MDEFRRSNKFFIFHTLASIIYFTLITFMFICTVEGCDKYSRCCTLKSWIVALFDSLPWR